jgi:hypothetical protein
MSGGTHQLYRLSAADEGIISFAILLTFADVIQAARFQGFRFR